MGRAPSGNGSQTIGRGMRQRITCPRSHGSRRVAVSRLSRRLADPPERNGSRRRSIARVVSALWRARASFGAGRVARTLHDGVVCTARMIGDAVTHHLFIADENLGEQVADIAAVTVFRIDYQAHAITEHGRRSGCSSRPSCRRFIQILHHGARRFLERRLLISIDQSLVVLRVGAVGPGLRRVLVRHIGATGEHACDQYRCNGGPQLRFHRFTYADGLFHTASYLLSVLFCGDSVVGPALTALG